MFNPTAAMIRHCVERLQTSYYQTYGSLQSDYVALIGQVATTTLEAIARTDALYHNVEHTILVTLVGQEILRGKQIREGNVSYRDWTHFIISLLCHDISYIKGICSQDDAGQRVYVTGVNGGTVTIAPGATDASLTPYHVDRSKQFVQENFADQPLIDVAVLKHNIELTRFPVPKEEGYQMTGTYPGLARAADLIGQLSDSRYLEKIPALFHEFEETGANQVLGYQHPGDVRAGYPTFFRQVVYPLIQDGLHYLEQTHQGRQILNDLYTNLSIVERELITSSQHSDNLPSGSPFFRSISLILQTWRTEAGALEFKLI